MRRTLVPITALIFAMGTLQAQADRAEIHCQSTLAKHKTITLVSADSVTKMRQYSKATCVCIVRATEKHLEKALLENMMSNHASGGMLALGDPKLKGESLVGDKYVTAFFDMKRAKRRAYTNDLKKQCGNTLPQAL